MKYVENKSNNERSERARSHSWGHKTDVQTGWAACQLRLTSAFYLPPHAASRFLQ